MRPAYTIIYICGQNTRKLLITFKTNDIIKGFSQNLNVFYGNSFPCLPTIAISIFLLTPNRLTYWITRLYAAVFLIRYEFNMYFNWLDRNRRTNTCLLNWDGWNSVQNPNPVALFFLIFENNSLSIAEKNR